MKLLLKMLSVVAIFGFSLDSYTMMKEESVIDRIADMSQKLEKINLRDYKGLEKDGDQTDDNNIKKTWFEDCIAGVESIIKSDPAGSYKDLKPLFDNVSDLSSQLFNAVMKINNSSGLVSGSIVKARKDEIDKLSKKQAEIKRFLLGQKAKSFFSFGKKQDEYKKIKQLLLKMVDMLNTKIDVMKKSVK